MLKTMMLTSVAVFLGMIGGKLISKHVLLPAGIPIEAGDVQSEGKVRA